MIAILDHSITQRWAPTRPDIVEPYSFPSLNVVKASIELEKTGLDYESHLVTLSDADVKGPEFLQLNQNNKIPAIIDPDGPNGETVQLWALGAILIYLAEKTGQLMPADGPGKYDVLKWLMFQMGCIGQMGFFVKFAGSKIEDPRPRDRYVSEAKRLLAVLGGAHDGKNWLSGDYSIADIAISPWLCVLNF